MKNNDFTIRVADGTDAQTIYDLMVEVYEQLENKSLYV